MSIQETLKSLQDAKALFPYEPTGTRSLARRRLYLTRRAEQDLTDPNSATNVFGCRGDIEAALTRWVSGRRVYGDRDVRFLKDLDPPPPEIWEIRVVEPPPQARLLGRFTEPDTMIITNFHTRPFLGRRGSQAWQEAMTECARQWEAFSPALPLFSAPSILNYVTENCDDVPIKLPRSNATGASRPRGLRRRSPPR